MQMPLFGPLLWSVSQLTRYLRELFESDEQLQDLFVQGEISNLSRPTSGHLYFTLKDSASALRCVMWRSAVQRQAYFPKDGDAVEVHGSINVYEASGQYQLYADSIRLAGEGLLFQEFLRLKAKLEAEGVFDVERKRQIPRWPSLIGIVTSPTGAALRDILNTLRRRFPLARVVLAPTAVQGSEAPGGIVSALELLNQTIHADVIILARGGGSIEDLWAFNDERVARAIGRSSAPVISGVGHETDFTIADFVSDLRAPTPTAAAELATPNQADLLQDLNDLAGRLQRGAVAVISDQRFKLQRLEAQVNTRSPLMRVRSQQQRLDEIGHRLSAALTHRIKIQNTELSALAQRLESSSPASILARGYAIVTGQDGSTVKSISQVDAGSRINIQVSDGAFGAIVQE
jgi:exodeoxyribonuclease VII large subunit